MPVWHRPFCAARHTGSIGIAVVDRRLAGVLAVLLLGMPRVNVGTAGSRQNGPAHPIRCLV